jgi:hypothetical protein
MSFACLQGWRLFDTTLEFLLAVNVRVVEVLCLSQSRTLALSSLVFLLSEYLRYSCKDIIPKMEQPHKYDLPAQVKTWWMCITCRDD